jgi:hypothetical protein
MSETTKHGTLLGVFGELASSASLSSAGLGPEASSQCEGLQALSTDLPHLFLDQRGWQLQTLLSG